MNRKSLLLAVVALSVAVTAGVRSLDAQSPEWAAQLVVTPFPSPYLSEWERNPQSLFLAVSYLGQGLREYRVEGVVRSSTRGEVARAESPLFTVPAGPAVERFNAADLYGWRILPSRPDDVEQVVRTGVLPEDDYELCARIYAPSGIQLAEDCAPMTVVLPDPPQLLFPTDGDGVAGSQPTFQWTPVQVPPALGILYRVRVVERLPGQTPSVALAANLPVLDEEGPSPLLTYPLDGIPLEAGREYAWQVEARDAMANPLRPGGLSSEIGLFRAESALAPGGMDGGAGGLDRVELVPGVAVLTGFSEAEREVTPFGHVLDGVARLELLVPEGVEVPVRMRGLVLDPLTQRVTGGSLVGEALAALGLEAALPPGVQAERLLYAPDRGVILEASFTLPGAASGGGTRLEGSIQLTPAGLYGTLEAELVGGAPAGLGSDPLEVRFTRVRAFLPEGSTALEGELHALGAREGECTLSAPLSPEGLWAPMVRCGGGSRVPLLGGSEAAGVFVTSLVGALQADMGSGRLDGELFGGITLALDGGQGSCFVAADLRLDPGGAEIAGVNPRCGTGGGAGVDLDWITLVPGNLRVERLEYRTGAGFELEARLELSPRIVSLPSLRLPDFLDVQITGEGLRLSGQASAAIPERFEVGGVAFRARQVRSGEHVLSWDAWDGGTAGDLSLEIDLEWSLPGLPDDAPGCLRSGVFTLSAATLHAGVLSGEMEGALNVEGDCRLPLGGGAELEVTGFSGNLTLSVAPEPELESFPSVTGRLHLPGTFVCGEGASGAVTLDAGAVHMHPNGSVTGTLTGVDTDCPLEVAGLLLHMDPSELTFDLGPGGGSLVLAGGGRVSVVGMEEPARGAGDIEVDLLTGRILSGALRLEEGFRFGLPAQEPLLLLQVDAAELDAEGFKVDGRGSLVLAEGDDVGATFLDVVLDLARPGLVQGEIRFDEAFALDAQTRPQGGLGWRAADPGQAFAPESGVRLVLPDEVLVTPEGIEARGGSRAILRFDDREFPSLDATFDDGFRVGFNPSGIEEGRVLLASGGLSLAWADRTGLHLNLAEVGAALLPDRLPLPTEAVGWVELRDETGSLRVEVTQEDGGMRVRTRAGSSAPLVLAGLGDGGAEPPSLGVAVDLLLDRELGIPLEGRVWAEVDGTVDTGAPNPLDLRPRGLPFVGNGVQFEVSAGEGEVVLEGTLLLAGQGVDAGGDVRLAFDAGGRLQGTVEGAATHSFSLVEGSDRLLFRGDRIRAHLELLPPGTGGGWWVEMEGALEFAPGEGAAYRVTSTLRSDATGLAFQALGASGQAGPSRFGAGSGEILVENLRVPRVRWTVAEGWDFELLVDMGIRPAGFEEVAMPMARDIRVDRDGLLFPALSVGELPPVGIPMAGFQVTPLALRSDPFPWNPFQSEWPVGWGVSVDLEIALDPAAAGLPDALRELRLTALDATWRDGRVSGQIEPRAVLAPHVVPLGGEALALALDRFGGALREVDGEQVVEVEAEGELRLSDTVLCPGAGAGAGAADGRFLLAGDGTLEGEVSGVAAGCVLALGPLEVEVGEARATVRRGAGESELLLALDGALRLPRPGGGTPILAPGSLEVELVALRIVDGAIQVNEAFAWDFPHARPGAPPSPFRFNVREARLDAEGFHFTGEGGLALEGGAQVALRFEDFTLGVPSLEVAAGRAVIEAGVALDATVGAGALGWQLRDPGALRPEGDGFRMVAPSGAILDAGGLRLTGTGSAGITLGGEAVHELVLEMEPDLRIVLSPLSVEEGRADFILDGVNVAYLDRTGFWPGDLFGVLPLPDRLGLPTESVAYLELRDPETGEARVETATQEGALRLVGSGVRLVLPGLAGSTSAPSLTLDVDLRVNPATFAPVSGELRVSGQGDAPLFDLSGMGLPLDVRSLTYADAGTGYRLSMGGQVRLPAGIEDMVLVWDQVTLAESGLSGAVGWGTLGAGPVGMGDGGPGAGPAGALSRLELGHATLELNGLRVDFDGRNTALEGQLAVALFSDEEGTPVPLPFAGTLAVGPAGTVSMAASLETPEGRGTLPLGVATFEPVAMAGNPALALSFAEGAMQARLGGVLRIPTLARDFELTLPGIEIDRSGVRFGGVSLEGTQAFGLFGAEVALREVEGSPALALELLEGRQLRLTLSGDMDFPFFDQRVAFRGLRIDSGGGVSVEGASLLSRPMALVPEVVTLAELGLVASNPGVELEIALDVTLPEPLPTGAQRASFRVASDGAVSGNGVVAILDASRDLEAALPPRGVVSAQLRYLGLDLGLGEGRSGSVQAVADLFLGNREENRIEVGRRSGGTTVPGLEVGFDGAVRWGNVALARTFEFDFDLVSLTLEEVSVTGDAERFEVGFGGELRLAIPGLEGGLAFEDFRVNDALEVAFSPSGVRGGDLTIGGVVGLALGEFGFSSNPATIRVASGSIPSGDAEVAAPGEVEIEVSSFVRFGGTVNILEFAGGMEEILFYRQEGDVAFVLRQAELAIPNLFNASADLRYFRQGDAGFELLVAADAELLGTGGATLVGMIESDGKGGDPRAGLFVSLSAQIPIIPPLFLAEIGGGFFYNARAEHLEWVASRALGSGTTPARGDPGKFTALLYAGAVIAAPDVARGAVLLTASEAGARLQGELTVLPVAGSSIQAVGIGSGGAPPIHGTVDVQVGFRQRFLEGNLALDVNLAPLASGSAQTAFWAYGEDAWGLMGSGDLNYMNLVNGGAEFFVGPPGFMVGANLGVGFDIWVVNVSAEAELAAWYQRAGAGRVEDLGAYFEAGAQVGILGGTLTAAGTLRGALLSGPLVYAGARMEGCAAALGCRDVDVWAKITGDGVLGGFGRDDTMAGIIERANSVRSAMEGARESLATELAQARPDPQLLLPSDEELAAAWRRLAGLDPEAFDAAFNALEQAEGLWSSAQAGYRSWYRGLFGVGRKTPEYAAGSSLPALELEGALSEIDELRDTVLDQLDGIRTELLSVQEVASRELRGSPVRTLSFALPQTQSGTDAEGFETRTLLSGPGFDVDGTASADARAEAEAHEVELQGYLAELAGTLVELDLSLAGARDALSSESPTGLLRFAERHADAIEAMEAVYTLWGAAILMERDLRRNQRNQLSGRRAEATSILREHANARSGQSLENLVRARVETLAQWSANPEILVSFNSSAPPSSNVTWWRDRAVEYGMQLWFEVGLAGLDDEFRAYLPEYQAIRPLVESRPAPIRDHLNRLTLDIHELQRLRAGLVGTTFDLYDRFVTLLEREGAGGGAVASHARERRSQLERDLSVPSVTSASVHIATDLQGYRRVEMVDVRGTHPSGGVREFLFQNRAGGGASTGFFEQHPTGLLSSGRRGVRTRYSLIPEPGFTGMETRTLRAGVRGGAGFLGFSQTTYQVGWADGEPEGATGTVPMNEPTTAPVAPTPRFRTPEGSWSSAAAGYWLTDANQVDLSLAGTHHTATGIQDIQYAVGTDTDTTAVRGWTSVGARRELSVHGLELRTGEANYVYGRALAANGVWSSVRRSVPLRYDPTHPSFGGGTFGPLQGALSPEVLAAAVEFSSPPESAAQIQGLNGAAFPACPLPDPVPMAPGSAEPSGNGTLSPFSALGIVSSGRQVAMVPPAVTGRWPRATDPESGVVAYAWTLEADQAPAAYQGEGWAILDPQADDLALGSGGGTLTLYGRSYHLALVARNAAGGWSPSVTTSFVPADPTPPLSPIYCIEQAAIAARGTRGDMGREATQPGFRIQVQDRAFDPETGIAGAAYRLRTAEGEVLRDFPGQPDWSGLATGASLEIPFSGGQDGTRYHLDIRSWNGQGLVSTASAGPLLFDTSPPPAPAIQGLQLGFRTAWEARRPSESGEVESMELRFHAPDDPHSGLRADGFQYAIYRIEGREGDPATESDGPRTQFQVALHYALSPEPVATGTLAVEALDANRAFKASLTRLHGLLEPGASYLVRVRTTNGANLPSATANWKVTVR